MCLSECPGVDFPAKNWRGVPVKHAMSPRLHKLDEGLQGMMRPRNGRHLFHTLAASEWVWAFLRGEYPGVALQDTWVAGKPGATIAHGPSGTIMRVIAPTEFGVLVWALDIGLDADGSVCFILRPNRQLLHWRHITKLDEWIHVPTRPILHPEGRIVWKKAGQPMPLPLAYCLTGNSILNAAQLKQLFKQSGIPSIASNSKIVLQKHLLEAPHRSVKMGCLFILFVAQDLCFVKMSYVCFYRHRLRSVWTGTVLFLNTD